MEESPDSCSSSSKQLNPDVPIARSGERSNIKNIECLIIQREGESVCVSNQQLHDTLQKARFAIPHHEMHIVRHHPTGNASSCCFVFVCLNATCYS